MAFQRHVATLIIPHHSVHSRFFQRCHSPTKHRQTRRGKRQHTPTRLGNLRAPLTRQTDATTTRANTNYHGRLKLNSTVITFHVFLSEKVNKNNQHPKQHQTSVRESICRARHVTGNARLPKCGLKAPRCCSSSI